MATRVSSSAVAVFTESGNNQWTYSTTINSSALTGATSSFGAALALHGDQLFIGDPGANARLKPIAWHEPWNKLAA